MDNRWILKASALKYLREVELLDKFQNIAVEHSRKCAAAKRFSPLILNFEIDLILLFSSSNLLYEMVVESPAAARRIFQEVVNDFLRNYLLGQDCQPSFVQLILRCTSFFELSVRRVSPARKYGFLSLHQNYVLISLSISHTTDEQSNLVAICSFLRCPDNKCPGHAGKYEVTEDLIGCVKLYACEYCAKKRYEEVAGRGLVRQIFAKFTPVTAFNRQNVKNFHAVLNCTVTDTLVDELKLGEMYDIWGYDDQTDFKVWGLKRKSIFKSIENIILSSFPSSIRDLWLSFGENGPKDAWSFARTLSLELGSEIYKKSAAMSLKMGLLLSLASMGNDKCASILCIGSNIDLVEEDVMKFAANCARRNVSLSFPLHANIVKTGKSSWLHSGSLLNAKSGVLDLGDWERLERAQKNDLVQALDDGYIVVEEKNAKFIVRRNVECFIDSRPLRTALWTYWRCEKNHVQSQPNDLQYLINLFGVPFLVDEKNTQENDMERLQLIFNGGKTNLRRVLNHELIEFLNTVNGIGVKLSEEAIKLIKDYFIATRKVRKDAFPSQSITFMTSLSLAHARLSLRTEATYDDVVAIIYLYEESMIFLYGFSTSTPPPFMKEINNVSNTMESFKKWLKLYLNSLQR